MKILSILLYTVLGLFLLLFFLVIGFEILNPSNACPIKDSTAVLKLKKDASELRVQLEIYSQKYGSYPSVDQGILALVEKPTVGKIPKNYKPIMKNKASVIDSWGTPYVLKYNSKGEPEIWTLGEDKKKSGEGKAKDFNIADFKSYPEEFKGKYD